MAEITTKMAALASDNEMRQRIGFKVREMAFNANATPTLIVSPTWASLDDAAGTVRRWKRLVMERKLQTQPLDLDRWTQQVLMATAIQNAVGAVNPAPEADYVGELRAVVTDTLVEARLKAIWQQMAEAEG